MALSLGVAETVAKVGDTSQIYTLDLYDDEMDLYLTDDYDPETIFPTGARPVVRLVGSI